MLSFFRRLIHSRLGVPITLGILILLGIGFVLTSGTGLERAGGFTGTEIASVNGEAITAEQVKERVKSALNEARQQNPKVTINEFIAAGQLDATIDQMINGKSMEQFAKKNGMVVSKRAIDGEIASIPAFRGIDGKFDQQAYQAQLARVQMTDAMVRNDLRTQMTASWLLNPVIRNLQAPEQVALPYVALNLEKRSGLIATLPSTAFPAGAAPSDAQIQAYYNTNKLRYVVPERRVVRYAIVTPEQLKGQIAPTDADVAAAYKAAGDKYAAAEKRSVSLVVVADQTTANAMAAKIKGGTPLAKAAADAGLAPSVLKDMTRATLTGRSSAAIADAAFKAPKGQLVGPVKSGLGWNLLVVDAITQTAGKTIEQARAELIPLITQRKTADLMQRLATTIDESITGRATFDEVVRDNKLAATATPALMANGGNPDDPKFKPDPALGPVLKAGFAMAAGDDPAVVPLGQDATAGFAVVKLDRVVAAAPRPLAQVKDGVVHDYQLENQAREARTAAAKIVAAVQRGTPLAQAVAAAGVKLPAPTPVSYVRGQIQKAGDNAPEPLRVLFNMKQGEVRLVPGPNRAGYNVVLCQQITPGALPAGSTDLVQARQQFSQLTQNEVAQQFLAAVRKEAKVTRNQAAIAKLRQELSGQGAE